MHYAIVTFGCRLNQADSLELEEALLDRGAQPSAPADADLILINTCSVTASADQGARQTVRRLARENPGARIVVTGCCPQRFAPHVHLPLQHASGAVLRAMRRPYTLEYYDRLVAGIRDRFEMSGSTYGLSTPEKS